MRNRLFSSWTRAATSAAAFFLAATAASAAAPLDIRRDATVTAVEKVVPSVVNIATETVVRYNDWYDEMLHRFYGRPRTALRSTSLGSGVIIDEEGYLLTNYHVVSRATRIQVKLADGREFDADRVVATTGSDVALLKIRSKPDEKFVPIQFAADDDLLLGETVLAVGNPFGLGISVTRGILSSKNRRPSTGDEPLNVEDWLQTDAAINPGNSGGPLVNLKGELIGLNVAVYREEDGQRGMGVGFSIPVKQVAAALAVFFTPEITDSLWLGAQFRAEDRPAAKSPRALKVAFVQPGSPAAKAGLKEGDRVLEINGKAPQSLPHASALIGASDQHLLKLAVSRPGANREAADRRELAVKMVPFDDLIREKLGLTLVEMSAKTAQKIGVRPDSGLYIDEVQPGSPAEEAKLQKGFVLASIENLKTSSLRDVAEVLMTKNKDDAVRVALIVPRRVGAYLELRQGAAELRLR